MPNPPAQVYTHSFVLARSDFQPSGHYPLSTIRSPVEVRIPEDDHNVLWCNYHGGNTPIGRDYHDAAHSYWIRSTFNIDAPIRLVCPICHPHEYLAEKEEEENLCEKGPVGKAFEEAEN